MLQSLCDTSPEVRQAAAYGVGVMAQYGGESYRPFCTGTAWHWSVVVGRLKLVDDSYMMSVYPVSSTRGHPLAGQSHPGS